MKTCRICGCDDLHACPGGCYWFDDLTCSNCAEEAYGFVGLLYHAWEKWHALKVRHTEQISSSMAYAAGFIDGEGCLTLLRHKPRKHGRNICVSAVLVVANCDMRPLLQLQSLFGGTIQARKNERSNCRKVYQWQLQGDKLRLALNQLSGFLVVKREQAELILNFLDSKRIRLSNGRYGLTPLEVESDAAFVTTIRQLNKRGPRVE